MYSLRKKILFWFGVHWRLSTSDSWTVWSQDLYAYSGIQGRMARESLAMNCKALQLQDSGIYSRTYVLCLLQVCFELWKRTVCLQMVWRAMASVSYAVKCLFVGCVWSGVGWSCLVVCSIWAACGRCEWPRPLARVSFVWSLLREELGYVTRFSPFYEVWGFVTVRMLLKCLSEEFPLCHDACLEP